MSNTSYILQFRQQLIVIGTLLSACFVMPGMLAAQTPTGKEVIEKHINAVGGQEALAKIKSLQSHAVKSSRNARSVSIDTVKTATAFRTTLAEIDVMHRPQAPYSTFIRNGETTWVCYAKTPVRLEGPNRDYANALGTLHPPRDWAERLNEAANVIASTVGDKATWRVTFTNALGQTVYRDFDQTSGLLLQESTRGYVTAIVTYRDYRRINGVLMAHQELHQSADSECELTYSVIKANAEIADGTFAIPPELMVAAGNVQDVDAEGAPTAADVIKKYVDAIGGKEAIAKITTLEFRGTRTGSGSFPIAIEQYIAKTGYLKRVLIPGFAPMLTGQKGNLRWQMDGDWSVKQTVDVPVDSLVREYLLEAARIPKYEDKIVVESNIAAEEPTWRLTYVGADGLTISKDFSKATGLLLREQVTSDDYEVSYSDYRKVAGVLIAHEVASKSRNGHDSMLKYHTIKANGDIQEETFDPPAGFDRDLEQAGDRQEIR